MTAISFPHAIVHPGMSFAATSGAAITEKFACVIRGASDGLVIQSAAANTVPLGFIQLYGSAVADAGEQVEVFYTGIVWAISAGAITVDTFVETAAAGRVQAASTGDYHVGIARKAATGAGEKIPIQISFGELA